MVVVIPFETKQQYESVRVLLYWRRRNIPEIKGTASGIKPAGLGGSGKVAVRLKLRNQLVYRRTFVFFKELSQLLTRNR